ncbi:MAG: DUF1285 domain-containing protein [Bermanella sp.]
MVDPTNSLSLAAQLGKYDESINSLPPIDSWTPELSGSMDMQIKKDGGWWHEGELIKRNKLTRLFSSILKKEGYDYFLVTPIEKWQIQVEDMPFMVQLADIKVKAKQSIVTLMTNVGDVVELNSGNTFYLDDTGLPFIEVRKGLMARLHRNVYYQLADLATENAGGQFVISSGGENHILG